MSNTDIKSDSRPWYKEPYPWMLIGLVSSTVVASLVTLAIAMSNPADLVVSDREYQQIRDEMRPSGHEAPKPSQPGVDDQGVDD